MLQFKLEILKLALAILAISSMQLDPVLAQNNETEAVEMFIRGLISKEIRELVYGPDFVSYISDKVTSAVQKNGDCMKQFGNMSRYDVENHRCIDCSDEKSKNSNLLLAICEVPLKIYQILVELKEREISSLMLLNRTDELEKKQNVLIGVVAIIGFSVIIIISVLAMWRKYRFNPSSQPEDETSNGKNTNGAPRSMGNGAIHHPDEMNEEMRLTDMDPPPEVVLHQR